MAPRKRHLQLHQLNHPFDDDYPFEAVLSGSWQPVKLIRIESGTTALHFIHTRQIQNPLSPDIRIKSRKATLSDCSSFLRPGIDISVLLGLRFIHDSDQFTSIPVWVDARIDSIQRQPHHQSNCSCQFYVNFYDQQGSLGSEIKSLNKEVIPIGVDQISIIQRLEHYCVNKPYRWSSSEDCISLSQSRFLLAKVLNDLSWFVATSVLKKVSFNITSIQNKIVYEVMGNYANTTISTSHIYVLNFRLKEGSVVPVIYEIDASHAFEEEEEEEEEEVVPPKPCYRVNGLRRSNRRNKQPDRYYGCAIVKLEVGNFRTWPYKRATYEIEDGKHSSDSEEDGDNGEKAKNNVNHFKEIKVYTRRKKTNAVKLDDANQNDDKKAEKNSDDVLNLDSCNEAAISCDVEVDDNVTLMHYYNFCRHKLKRKRIDHGFDDMDFENKWEGIHFRKGVQQKRYSSILMTNKSHVDEDRDHKGGRALNADACKEIIDSYMKNIDSLPTEEEVTINEHEQMLKTSKLEPKEEEKVPKSHDVEEEFFDDLDVLWEEMDTAWLSSNLLDGTEGSNAEKKEFKNTCEHDYKLDEEIGIYCLRCGFVKTAIRDISEIVVENPKWYREEKENSGEQKENESEAKVDKNDDDSHVFSNHSTPPDESLCKEYDNVWSLIPELKEKMHAHQKKAFEFLWQNIAGSIEPKLMKVESKTSGGCVISHAPGAGKTFLIISFLLSYMKLFPDKRPLVLAPKTTLYTWRKEFKKWKIPMPVYLIHGRRSWRGSTTKPIFLPGVPRPTGDVKHVLDCLTKIQKWISQPSVLVMGYTSFLTMMREDTKFAHRKYMSKTLRESSNILILDEGHNPRSTKSRLRKCLMKLPTELRILLSGTLFQNNFCEYFNTLCLARPMFVRKVLKELDPKFNRRGRIAKKARHLLEARARKFFLDNIAKKINSDIDEERMIGLNVLRKITTGFIDVYDSGNSDTLPGLQIYTLLMNTTDIQKEMLQKLQNKMFECTGYPLEIELLITLGSIHPWLIKTASFASRFFEEEELKKLEGCKFDLKKSSKVRFVMSLISRVVKNEKVIIFCHNLAPVRLLIELFESYFQWENGKEILLLTGELELYDRGKVIEKFENPRGSSKVLVASITACGEGISLTAASRVIFLDSEWNPSKTKQAIARAFRPGQEKMVYVYQLLITGSMEEDKYRRTTWKEKEWVSCLIFSEEFVEDPSKWQAQKIEDEILREMVEEDKSKAIHIIMKNEKASTT
ncbi:LOW QUALITY PROTEIN: SNF2 domain-containing protein CLASSY 1-like [Cicer arietinum]|uniref:LOW QUALITY PROTEIN: SNF2 domain-containing protein CLASSY 1-like n=1 Tax=Cicer arietinum TaxID=3827 RepID=A0A1S3E6C9_CICAR|nr:LOW QUALITY PROTEIN: SNF2 domain-containing protein CLASSY 1-like [Cicer arietinum]